MCCRIKVIDQRDRKWTAVLKPEFDQWLPEFFAKDVPCAIMKVRPFVTGLNGRYSFTERNSLGPAGFVESGARGLDAGTTWVLWRLRNEDTFDIVLKVVCQISQVPNGLFSCATFPSILTQYHGT